MVLVGALHSLRSFRRRLPWALGLAVLVPHMCDNLGAASDGEYLILQQGRPRVIHRYMLLSVVAATTGCASVVNDVTHPVKIETKTDSGELVSGAQCTLTNDKASTTAKSGETANVRRSSTDLSVVCKHPDNPDATAKATSRVNGGMFGNIILGGGIGAVIDHNRGTAYTYPTWMQLVFGKSLAFDRRDEKDGQPTPPTAATTTAKADDKKP